MRNYLFVCSQNKLRSPTAEHIFADAPGIATASAGTNNDADSPLTDELVEWADFVFVMERQHRNKLQKKHRAALKDKRVIILDIPDEYEFMDPHLIRLLRTKMQRWMPSAEARKTKTPPGPGGRPDGVGRSAAPVGGMEDLGQR